MHDYNSRLYRISLQLRICGEKIINEDMLKRAFPTFHASNMVLQQQYGAHECKKYYDLIS